MRLERRVGIGGLGLLEHGGGPLAAALLGAGVPAARLVQILGHAQAELVQITDLRLALGIALLGGTAVPLHGGGIVGVRAEGVLIHVAKLGLRGGVVRDIEEINLELCLADLDTIVSRIGRIAKKAQTKDKDAMREMDVLSRLKDALEAGRPVRLVELNKDEKAIIRGYGLLTAKPVIYVANMSDEEIADPESNSYFQKVRDFAAGEGSECIAICAKIEEELSGLDKEEKKAFLEDLGIRQSGLDQIIQAAYHLLGLRTFFTVGEPECRAWTFREGMKAPQCAGIIHTDFEKGFIRAEIYSYEDFMEYHSEAALKEHGRIRLEGKEYLMKDGDIVFFRFNV